LLTMGSWVRSGQHTQRQSGSDLACWFRCLAETIFSNNGVADPSSTQKQDPRSRYAIANMRDVCAAPIPTARAKDVFDVAARVVDSNQSAPQFSQFSQPSSGNTKCLPTFSLRHKVSPSLLALSAGWTNPLRRSLHLRCCCRKRFQFVKSVNRSLQSPPDFLARAPVPFCKHPSVSTRPWRRKKLQVRSRSKKTPAQDNRPAQPISSFVRTSLSAASEAARQLFPQLGRTLSEVLRESRSVASRHLSLFTFPAATGVQHWQKRKPQPRPLPHSPAIRVAQSCPVYQLRCDDN